jgi:hypothetical protein
MECLYKTKNKREKAAPKTMEAAKKIRSCSCCFLLQWYNNCSRETKETG